MPVNIKGFDAKCRELAVHFLPGVADEMLIDEFADHIQGACEDWLNDHEHEIVEEQFANSQFGVGA